MFECFKRDDCKNYGYKCAECKMTSGVVDNFPFYKHRFSDMTHLDFLDEVELLAVSRGLRFFLERAPIGSGFVLYFHHDEHNTDSERITWFHQKQDFEEVYYELKKLAKKFKKENAYDTHKPAE